MRDQNRRFDVPQKDVSPIVGREAQSLNSPPGLRPDRIAPAGARKLPWRRIHPLASLRSHLLVALSAAALVLLAGIVAAWILGKTVFYTEAVISVSPPRSIHTEGGREGESAPAVQFDEYLQRQLRTVNRYDIVLATLRGQPELARAWRRPNESEQRAVERLQEALVIRPVPNTSLFTVGLEGERTGRLAELVNALVNNYIKRERADELKHKDQYVELLQAERKRLTDELVHKQAQVNQLDRSTPANQAALTLEYEIGSLRKRLAALDDRLNSSMLELEVPGFTRLFESAREPENPLVDGRLRYLLAAFLLALALGVAVPAAIDLLDPRLHSAGEVERLIGAAPIASVVEMTEGENQDLARDQITRLAYTLDRQRRHRGARVFLFTSAERGGGTTTLVLELAQALTRLDLRTIAVEAGALKPDSNYVTPENELGLIDVLTARCRVSEAVNPETDSLPARMSIGKLGDQHQLPDIQYLPGTLRLLADRYEVILIDAAPLLASSDTELLVGFADSTVLVLESAGVHRQRALQAAQLLETLSGTAPRIVLNRVTLDRLTPPASSDNWAYGTDAARDQD
jgi:Mrp family chromosome partitioning ATPase